MLAFVCPDCRGKGTVRETYRYDVAGVGVRNLCVDQRCRCRRHVRYAKLLQRRLLRFPGWV